MNPFPIGRTIGVSAALVLYLYVLLKVILFKYGQVDPGVLLRQLSWFIEHPGRLLNRLHQANFTPFVSINQNLERMSNRHDFVNLFGNIAIFIPFGFLLAALGRRWSDQALLGIIGSFATSLALECAQLVFTMGSFDVDDLILNTGGGIIGLLLWYIAAGISRIWTMKPEKMRKAVR